MRKRMGNIEREPDGSWAIAPDHPGKVERYEAHQLRDRPVTVETLSPEPLEKLVDADAATWLDRELVASLPEPLRDAGFGHDAREAQARRRLWLIPEQLGEEQDGRCPVSCARAASAGRSGGSVAGRAFPDSCRLRWAVSGPLHEPAPREGCWL